MHKLFFSTGLLLAVMLFFTACGQNGDTTGPDLTLENVRLAFIHVGDTNDRGYTYRQHAGTVAMMNALGISEGQVLNFWNIAPGAAVTTSIEEAIEWGANMIFATSFGHGPFMHEAAQQFPDVHFFHATGNLAVEANLPNFHNYFGNMSQARFLSGIAAGLRTETNRLGFVAAWPNPEVITGYTAFFLGARSVNPEVQMYVMYLNAWNNPTVEGQLAQALIDLGADVLGQHADSPTTQTVAQANGVWSVGYNNDMSIEAPDAFLLAPMFAWEVYLIYAVRTFVEGGNVRTDVLYGLNEGMVVLSDLNPSTIAPGTAEAIAAAEARLRAGWNIFTGPLYGADGTQLLAPGVEWIEPLSAPSWNFIIEGITER
ncbi:MAG: BMP family ABC transporter substrate-binding protein [Defluviitaleaceae bacterium]|nr:BMP family ABC transporter substrate-binding protein [Defluviitaleaceae bacterium]MCL2239507.1 BMP family ABC transporter substrate-binding protein [Defluviitaleaceae bacterium]